MKSGQTTHEVHSPDPDIVALENDIGVRRGFFRALLSEGDDWSFVIKTHALIEAAVSHLLGEVTGHPELVHTFSQIELSGVRTGKLAFAEVLGCLDASERQTIRKLSELRNRLVHDVSNVDFTFDDWTQSLDKNQMKAFVQAFGPGSESFDIDGTQVLSTEFFKQNARLNIWVACLFLLSLIYQRKDLARVRREAELSREKLLQQILAIRRTSPKLV